MNDDDFKIRRKDCNRQDYYVMYLRTRSMGRAGISSMKRHKTSAMFDLRISAPPPLHHTRFDMSYGVIHAFWSRSCRPGKVTTSDAKLPSPSQTAGCATKCSTRSPRAPPVLLPLEDYCQLIHTHIHNSRPAFRDCPHEILYQIRRQRRFLYSSRIITHMQLVLRRTA